MMLTTVVLIQIITSIVQLHIIKGITLEEGSQLTCEEDTMISAILEDLKNPNLVHLFSGNIVWKMKLSDFALQEVYKIEERFNGVSGTIECAAYSTLWSAYILGKRDEVLNYSLITKRFIKLKKERILRVLEGLFNIDDVKELFNCATLHDDFDEGVHHMKTVDFNGRTLDCSLDEDGKAGDVRHPCFSSSVESLGVPNPAGVPASEFKGTTCEGMFIKFVNKAGVTWQFLYADKENLRLWHDRKLNQSVNLRELFGCYSPWASIILVGVVIIVVIVIAVTSLILLYSFKNRSVENDPLSAYDTTVNA